MKRPSKARNTSFCCCTGNFCNSNITEGYLTEATDVYPEEPGKCMFLFMSLIYVHMLNINEALQLQEIQIIYAIDKRVYTKLMNVYD